MRKERLYLVLLWALLPFVGWSQQKNYLGQHINIKQATGDSIQTNLIYASEFRPVVKNGEIEWEFGWNYSNGFTLKDVTNIDFPSYKTDSIEVRKALIEFYHAMDGDNWTHNDNWCSDKPIWEWYGVNNSCKYNNSNKAVPYVMELNLTENKLSGEIPEGCLTKMGPMMDLYIWGNKIKGAYPNEVNRIYSLGSLSIACNQFSGPLPWEAILSLPNLCSINFEENYFEGSLPDGEAVNKFFKDKSPTWFIVRNNLFKGEVPEVISKDPHFSSSWLFILPQREAGLNLSAVDIPAPVFHKQYMDGSPANSDEIYHQNKYTLIYKWGWWCPYSEGFNKRLIPVYNAYKDKGFEVIGIHAGDTDKLPEYLEKYPVPWKNIDFDEWVSHVGEIHATDEDEAAVLDFVENWLWSPSLLLVDQKGNIVFSTFMDENGMTPQDDRNWKVFDVLEKEFGPVEYDFYTSTDYSHDGEVVNMQQAYQGQGIDLVFVGEGFTDKDFDEGGAFDQRMNQALNQFFFQEPYGSLRGHFNVYAVKAVSPNAEFYGNATHAIDNDISKAFEYASKVPNLIPNRPMYVNVIYNNNSGERSYCVMLEDNSYVCFSMDGVSPVLNHEAGGHGIGKLLDEYVEPGYENLSLPEENKAYLDNVWKDLGWGANVDWRSNPTEVKWAKFISDERYAAEKIGVYEGSYLYQFDAYRPTENSIMRNSNLNSLLGFNAPSREAIYKRVMKESEGDNWVYDYEVFVAFDEAGRNRFVEALTNAPRRASKASEKQQLLTAPPVFVKGTWRDALKKKQ